MVDQAKLDRPGASFPLHHPGGLYSESSLSPEEWRARLWRKGEGIDQAFQRRVGDGEAQDLLQEEAKLELVGRRQEHRRDLSPDELHVVPFQAAERGEGTQEVKPPPGVVEDVRLDPTKVPAVHRGVL